VYDINADEMADSEINDGATQEDFDAKVSNLGVWLCRIMFCTL